MSSSPAIRRAHARVARRCRALVTALLCPLAVTSLLASCDGARPARASAGHGCGPSVPHTSVQFARNFSIAYHCGYKLLTVRAPYPGGPAQRYVLLEQGASAKPPAAAARGATRVTVPVHSVFSESTTQLPALVDIGAVGAITGVASTRYVVSPVVRRHLRRSHVVEFAPTGDIDVERVVASKPDVFFTQGTTTPAYEKLRAAGVPVVAVAEYLEPTPLGQAEWSKFIAAFFDREDRASRAFAAVAARYGALRARISVVADRERPSVMTGYADSGTFYEKGGRSVTATLIHDAGGRSVWSANRSTGPLEIDLERELHQAANAQIWIDGSQFWTSLADVARDDPRYRALRPYRTAQVWVPNRVRNANGGLDYFERGIARPDLVLADLIRILHPDRAPRGGFTFYERLS